MFYNGTKEMTLRQEWRAINESARAYNMVYADMVRAQERRYRACKELVDHAWREENLRQALKSLDRRSQNAKERD